MTTTNNASPEPIPSISTPLLLSQAQEDIKAETNKRHRRHTIITRPDSAVGLLSDLDYEEQEQEETFDRISGILSSLIQEANEAVQSSSSSIKKDRVTSTTKPARIFTSSTIISSHHHHPHNNSSHSTENSSRIPRPQQQYRRTSKTPRTHVRNISSSSCSSTNSNSTNVNISLFSPISTTSTSATSIISRSPSPTISTFNKKQFRHHHHHHHYNNNVLRPRSCPVIQPTTSSSSSSSSSSSRRSSMTPNKYDPITESFKRLDTSMALVDSLSRDLAEEQEKGTTTNNSTLLLLLVPLLHIPHSLITMIFDFVTSPSSSSTTASTTTNQFQLIRSSNNSFSFSSMIFWACVFAVTNLMVDQVAVIPKKYLNLSTKKMNKSSPLRRMSLPGAFNTTPNKKKSSKVPNSQHKKQQRTIKSTRQTTVPSVTKRTWIPATVQQQYQFRLLGEQAAPPQQKRRNSI